MGLVDCRKIHLHKTNFPFRSLYTTCCTGWENSLKYDSVLWLSVPWPARFTAYRTVHQRTQICDNFAMSHVKWNNWTSQQLGVGTISTHSGLCTEAPPERGTYSTPEVYERVGISQIEVQKRTGKIAILIERAFRYILKRPSERVIHLYILRGYSKKSIEKRCRIEPLRKLYERETIFCRSYIKLSVTFSVKYGI